MDLSFSGQIKKRVWFEIVRVLFATISLFADAQHAVVTDVCIAPVCTCMTNPVYNVTASCNTTQLKSDLQSYITKPHLVLALSVTDNNTSVIPSGAFSGLSSLMRLELNMKQLKTWRGNISHDLPSIETIHFSGNSMFIPPHHVLRTQNIQTITGVSWSTECKKCALTKNETHSAIAQWRKGVFEIYSKARCRGMRYVVGSMSRNFAEHGFIPSCLLDNEKCNKSEIQEIPTHQCWEKANQVLYVEYFLAPLIIVLNSLVVMTILSTKSLRRIPTMLLVTNMACSDFFVGVYSLAISSYRHFLPYPKFVEVTHNLCPTLGFIWTTGQFMAASSSIFLTMERYIAIIFSMRPSISFTRIHCLVCMFGSWVVAVLIASLPLFNIGTYTSTTFCVPIQPVQGIPHSFAYSASLVAIGVLLYMTTLPLYLHIFIHVRRSSHVMGIKRDGKLAKKISLLVSSNLIFFMLPVFIGLLWLFTKTFENIALTSREILVGSLTTIFFSTNSFLNPLLYAFRDRRFQMAIKHRFYRIVHRNTVFAQNSSYVSRRDSRSQFVSRK